MSRGEWVYQVAAHIVVVLVALACLIPFLYVVSISLTPVEGIIRVGRFAPVPQHITLGVYRMALEGGRIVQGFGVSGGGNDAAVTPEAWTAIGNTQYRMAVVALVSLPIILL